MSPKLDATLEHEVIKRAWEELDWASGRTPPDWDELRRLDQAFHLVIARFLSRTVEVLHDMLAAGMETTLTIPGRLERSCENHHRITHAILRLERVKQG